MKHIPMAKTAAQPGVSETAHQRVSLHQVAEKVLNQPLVGDRHPAEHVGHKRGHSHQLLYMAVDAPGIVPHLLNQPFGHGIGSLLEREIEMDAKYQVIKKGDWYNRVT